MTKQTRDKKAIEAVIQRTDKNNDKTHKGQKSNQKM